MNSWTVLRTCSWLLQLLGLRSVNERQTILRCDCNRIVLSSSLLNNTLIKPSHFHPLSWYFSWNISDDNVCCYSLKKKKPVWKFNKHNSTNGIIIDLRFYVCICLTQSLLKHNLSLLSTLGNIQTKSTKMFIKV